jgi:methylated-DNA-[protein]-cysteine S-methyltransferase
MNLQIMRVDSPIGVLTLAADEDGLCGIEFPPPRASMLVETARAHRNGVLLETREQLAEYFAGTRRAFDLPLAPHGTEFQRAVWAMLPRIPYGETRTYGDIARRIGRPDAVRAVGAANGRNPIPIVLPCHRVIGADGSLTGFGGGLPTKAFLLRLEGALRDDDLFAA